MKTNPSHNPDPLLSGVLKEWKIQAVLPPRFEDRVWQRISRAEETQPRAAFAAWFGAVQGFFCRPSLAASYVALLLLLGFAAGWSRGQGKSARIDHDLSTRYVQEIDPYHMNHNP